MAKAAQGNEVTLLHNRSKVNKRVQGEPKPPTKDTKTRARGVKDPRGRPQEGNDTLHYRHRDPFKGSTQIPNAEKAPTTASPRGLQHPQTSPLLASKH
jgi:hypothetical protein